MKICLIDYYMEHCSLPDHGTQLAKALEGFGHTVMSTPAKDCQYIICGSIFKQAQAFAAIEKYPQIPMIAYNWDLYSYIWTHKTDYDWVGWGKLLNACDEVWCPSECTALRTNEYYGQEINTRILKTNIWPWALPDIALHSGDYVVDVMRAYPDPNCGLVERVCNRVGIKCVTPNHKLDFKQFKELIGGARVLVSAYHEASTGGLSLLEGYYHGKPVLLSDSPWHGGIDYFGHRPGVRYFKHKSEDDLEVLLTEMYVRTPQLNRDECRQWVTNNYHVDCMASDMHERLVNQ